MIDYTGMLLRVIDAARILGVHENTIRGWVKRGILEAVVPPGGSYQRIVGASVTGLLEDREHRSLARDDRRDRGSRRGRRLVSQTPPAAARNVCANCGKIIFPPREGSYPSNVEWVHGLTANRYCFLPPPRQDCLAKPATRPRPGDDA